MKLGKAPARHDARTLRMARYLTTLVSPPAAIDYTKLVSAWPMMLNDKLGDCTCACAGHFIQEWTTLTQKPFVPVDAAVEAMYSAITGYQPGNPATDNGAVVLDVLNYWRQIGLAGHRIMAYAAVNPGHLLEVQASIYLFGGMYLGVQLPASAQDQDVWTVPDGGPVRGGEVGSWGGHAVPVMAYDTEGLTCITWGATKRMSWAFFQTYCDEAYAVLSPDWIIAATQVAPNNFDLGLLQTELQVVTA